MIHLQLENCLEELNYFELTTTDGGSGRQSWVEIGLGRKNFTSNVSIKSVVGLIIAIAANLYFGIYFEAYFYTNLVLLGVLFELFFEKKINRLICSFS